MIKYAFFLFFSIASCGQKDGNPINNVEKTNNIKQERVMEKFDNKSILNKKAVEAEYSADNDSIINQKELADAYVEQKFIAGSPLKKQKQFDKKTLNITNEGNFFYGVAVGVHKAYDTHGKLLAEDDLDAKYPVSVTEVVSKIKKLYKVDMNTTVPGLFFDRYLNDNNKPEYYIHYPVKENSTEVRAIVIDGDTGKVLSDKIDYLSEE
jgi:hypothetical protein